MDAILPRIEVNRGGFLTRALIRRLGGTPHERMTTLEEAALICANPEPAQCEELSYAEIEATLRHRLGVMYFALAVVSTEPATLDADTRAPQEPIFQILPKRNVSNQEALDYRRTIKALVFLHLKYLGKFPDKP